MWDLSWNSPTPTGLATIEINLALVCAALPIFWPVLQERWGRILVTYEVKVTRESGIWSRKAQRPPPQTSSSERELTGSGGEPESFQPTEWDPYVRDTKTAFGDSETTVVSPKERPVQLTVLDKEKSWLV